MKHLSVPAVLAFAVLSVYGATVVAAEPAKPAVKKAVVKKAVVKKATAKPAAKAAAATAGGAAVAATAAPKADLARGQQIYRQACAVCHDKGVAGAPKLDDKAAWTARLAQGTDALYNAALRGKNAMPAKGGNPSLADADVKSAVDFMAAQVR